MIQQQTTHISFVSPQDPINLPVESNPNLRQEPFPVLPTQPLLSRIPNGIQKLATQLTRLCICPCKAQLVIFGLVIVLLLLGKEITQPFDDPYIGG
jgi:hypothetical protein